MILRVVARNSATASENRIHSDEVAREYGFRSGLVPGVTVFGYLMRALSAWPRGLEVKLLKPVTAGDELAIGRAGNQVTAQRGGDLCARLTTQPFGHDFAEIPEKPLPQREQRPWATAQTVVPGMVLGTMMRPLDDAEPETLLNLANHALLENFLLKPWLHVASEIVYVAAAHVGEEVAVRSRIHQQYEKKGREFLVLDLALWQGPRHLQSIRHTAIYRLDVPS